MLLKGDVIIHALWQNMPGVEQIETVDDLKRRRAVVTVGLGLVKACFSGDVEADFHPTV